VADNFGLALIGVLRYGPKPSPSWSQQLVVVIVIVLTIAFDPMASSPPPPPRDPTFIIQHPLYPSWTLESKAHYLQRKAVARHFHYGLVSDNITMMMVIITTTNTTTNTTTIIITSTTP
jgi:hypothetical protein